MTPIPRLRAGDLLAAYGLLRPSSYGLDVLRARGRVRDEGPCRIPGRLVDLGRYPGLVPGLGQVAGDLVRVLDARVGDLLDAYEDLDRSDPQSSAYRRVRMRLVRPAVWAWVYVWNGAADAGPLVPGGDWLRRAAITRRPARASVPPGRP